MILSCTDKRDSGLSPVSPIAGLDSASGPAVTIIAQLPDSLQPKICRLDTAPKPRTIAIPIRNGDHYTSTSTAGEEQIALTPPVTIPLPVLKKANGEIMRDSAGKPFIMGYGGRSHFINITTDEGLPMDAVRCSYTDRMGNLWFGTQGGLSRYDGKSFVNFTTAQGLADNSISCIAEDRKGNFWFGMQNGGLSRYDGRSFRNFSTSERHTEDPVSSVAEDHNGNLWFGTLGSGLCRYDGKSFVTLSTAQGLIDNKVRCLTIDRRGNLWIGTSDGGVSRYDGRSFVNYSTAEGLASNNVYSILEDRKGNLWFGTYGGGLSRFDGKSFVTFSMAQGLAGDRVASIAEDRKGNLWFGTYGGGLSCYDGRSFITFSPAQGLASKNVTCITEDKEGHLWFGTYGGGLSHYDGKSFVTFSSLLGLSDNLVFSIAEDRKGDMWFGTFSGGVCRYDGKSFTNYTKAQGLAGNNVMSMANDCAGDLWLGTQLGGVSRYDGRSFVTYSTVNGLPANYVSCILKDKNCQLWFGTVEGGLSRFDGKAFVNYSEAQGLPHNSVRCIAEDRKGNLWVGTEHGLSRFDGKAFANFSAAQGLANERVWCVMLDDRGNLWVGTEGGLYVLPQKELQVFEMQIGREVGGAAKERNSGGAHFRRFIRRDGLPDNSINQIMQLPGGEIVVGTNHGIATFRPTVDFSKLAGIETYNSSTDCPVKDVNNGQNCLFRDSKGIIWASTGNVKTALVRFDLSSLPQDTAALIPTIQGIRVDGENISWYGLLEGRKVQSTVDSTSVPASITEEVTIFGALLRQSDRDSMKQRFGDIRFDSISRFYPVPQHLVLPYSHNDITIDFNAVETGHPKLVRYKYILEGYDDAWSPAVAEHSATFGNIREGRYTFRLMARHPDGAWSAPVIYKFRVLPPWYRTWWAILSYILLIISIMLAFSKWRQKALRKEKEKLARKVEERTAVVVKQKKRLEKEKQRSDELLLNILPAEVAEELKISGTAKAKQFDHVTVLFTDFMDFTRLSETMSPQALIDELHACFTAFDAITARHNIEKIKTIGDAYLAVAGLPVSDGEHAVNVVRAALEIKAFMDDRHLARQNNAFKIRIGVHSGSVVAGIVGIKKFGYDIWGDTVNTAARMEQHSEAGKVNISQTTYDLVKEHFTFVYRGEIAAKNKGKLRMYFVEGVAR